ncbi:histidine phosphatase family protein [Nocardioides anomalus]|uniref:Histidine phosphatase family protein n=1 Tax=Nocardioides anomalus TaxID=2712223 RepID=A0A6G6WF79_9ACTN|nr:histidine phosphatase family protein [Nocardioides anomalus]QIG43755.1 histidine phosphatase family protein [Nocardioides anomalus]
MSELVLLRHGRTDWNAERRLQGQSQSQLDELGRAQAAATAPVLAALGPTVLWSSDADRTRATAAYVASATGLEPRFDPRLREYSFGALEGLLATEFEAADPDGFAAYRVGEWDRVPEVERYADVAARTTAALSELAGLLGPGDTGVAVSHGAAIRTATATLLGWGRPQAETMTGLDNCGWVVLRRRGPDAPWRLAAYNRTVAPDFIQTTPVG